MTAIIAGQAVRLVCRRLDIEVTNTPDILIPVKTAQKVSVISTESK